MLTGKAHENGRSAQGKVCVDLSVIHSRESAGVNASHNQKLRDQRKLAGGRRYLGAFVPAASSDILFLWPVRWSFLNKGVDTFFRVVKHHITRHCLPGNCIGPR